MNHFAALLATLDTATDPATKATALAQYFRTCPGPDCMWCIALLSGRRPKRAATTAELRLWCLQVTGLPDWLFAQSHAIVGDMAETVASLVPPAQRPANHSLTDIITAITALSGQDATQRRAATLSLWQDLTQPERILFNKLITGSFRTTLGQTIIVHALSDATGTDRAKLAHRLAGDWSPTHTTFADLASGTGTATGPYPCARPAPLAGDVTALGDPEGWRAEWQWDGLRAQLICRPDGFALWSGDGDLVTDRFPELTILARHLPPGTVLDGNLLVWRSTIPLSRADLQKRLGPGPVTKRRLAEAPARFMAFDLLEDAGADLRAAPLSQRRDRLAARLASLPPDMPIDMSPTLAFTTWAELCQIRTLARDRGAKGVMLKRSDAPYPGADHGTDHGAAWRAWPCDPHKANAVLIYVQAGQGGRSAPVTEFTFALRHGNDLAPIGKAPADLPDADMAQITRWVSGHIAERFGPVRRVVPELVFEIAFDDLRQSPRHKSGIVLINPRVLRWRQDMTPDQIDRLDSLHALSLSRST
jgi:DNA ligase 1